MYSINEAGIPTFMLPREKKNIYAKGLFHPKILQLSFTHL